MFYQDFVPGKSTTSILKTIYSYLKKKGILHDANNQPHAVSMSNSTTCEHESGRMTM